MAKPRVKSPSDARQSFFVFIVLVSLQYTFARAHINYLNQVNLQSLYIYTNDGEGNIYTNEGEGNAETCLKINHQG